MKYSFDVGVDINKSDPENFMVERMTKIIEQFAITGYIGKASIITGITNFLFSGIRTTT